MSRYERACVDDFFSFYKWTRIPDDYTGTITFNITCTNGDVLIKSVRLLPFAESIVWDGYPPDNDVTVDCSCAFETFYGLYQATLDPTNAVLTGKVAVKMWRYRQLSHIMGRHDFAAAKWDEFYALVGRPDFTQLYKEHLEEVAIIQSGGVLNDPIHAQERYQKQYESNLDDFDAKLNNSFFLGHNTVELAESNDNKQLDHVLELMGLGEDHVAEMMSVIRENILKNNSAIDQNISHSIENTECSDNTDKPITIDKKIAQVSAILQSQITPTNQGRDHENIDTSTSITVGDDNLLQNSPLITYENGIQKSTSFPSKISQVPQNSWKHYEDDHPTYFHSSHSPEHHREAQILQNSRYDIALSTISDRFHAILDDFREKYQGKYDSIAQTVIQATSMLTTQLNPLIATFLKQSPAQFGAFMITALDRYIKQEVEAQSELVRQHRAFLKKKLDTTNDENDQTLTEATSKFDQNDDFWDKFATQTTNTFGEMITTDDLQAYNTYKMNIISEIVAKIAPIASLYSLLQTNDTFYLHYHTMWTNSMKNDKHSDSHGNNPIASTAATYIHQLHQNNENSDEIDEDIEKSKDEDKNITLIAKLNTIPTKIIPHQYKLIRTSPEEENYAHLLENHQNSPQVTQNPPKIIQIIDDINEDLRYIALADSFTSGALGEIEPVDLLHPLHFDHDISEDLDENTIELPRFPILPHKLWEIDLDIDGDLDFIAFFNQTHRENEHLHQKNLENTQGKFIITPNPACQNHSQAHGNDTECSEAKESTQKVVSRILSYPSAVSTRVKQTSPFTSTFDTFVRNIRDKLTSILSNHENIQDQPTPQFPPGINQLSGEPSIDPPQPHQTVKINQMSSEDEDERYNLSIQSLIDTLSHLPEPKSDKYSDPMAHGENQTKDKKAQNYSLSPTLLGEHIKQVQHELSTLNTDLSTMTNALKEDVKLLKNELEQEYTQIREIIHDDVIDYNIVQFQGLVYKLQKNIQLYKDLVKLNVETNNENISTIKENKNFREKSRTQNFAENGEKIVKNIVPYTENELLYHNSALLYLAYQHLMLYHNDSQYGKNKKSDDDLGNELIQNLPQNTENNSTITNIIDVLQVPPVENSSSHITTPPISLQTTHDTLDPDLSPSSPNSSTSSEGEKSITITLSSPSHILNQEHEKFLRRTEFFSDLFDGNITFLLHHHWEDGTSHKLPRKKLVSPRFSTTPSSNHVKRVHDTTHSPHDFLHLTHTQSHNSNYDNDNDIVFNLIHGIYHSPALIDEQYTSLTRSIKNWYSENDSLHTGSNSIVLSHPYDHYMFSPQYHLMELLTGCYEAPTSEMTLYNLWKYLKMNYIVINYYNEGIDVIEYDSNKYKVLQDESIPLFIMDSNNENIQKPSKSNPLHVLNHYLTQGYPLQSAIVFAAQFLTSQQIQLQLDPQTFVYHTDDKERCISYYTQLYTDIERERAFIASLESSEDYNDEMHNVYKSRYKYRLKNDRINPHFYINSPSIMLPPTLNELKLISSEFNNEQMGKIVQNDFHNCEINDADNNFNFTDNISPALLYHYYQQNEIMFDSYNTINPYVLWNQSRGLVSSISQWILPTLLPSYLRISQYSTDINKDNNSFTIDHDTKIFKTNENNNLSLSDVNYQLTSFFKTKYNATNSAYRLNTFLYDLIEDVDQITQSFLTLPVAKVIESGEVSSKTAQSTEKLNEITNLGQLDSPALLENPKNTKIVDLEPLFDALPLPSPTTHIANTLANQPQQLTYYLYPLLFKSTETINTYVLPPIKHILFENWKKFANSLLFTFYPDIGIPVRYQMVPMSADDLLCQQYLGYLGLSPENSDNISTIPENALDSIDTKHFAAYAANVIKNALSTKYEEMSRREMLAVYQKYSEPDQSNKKNQNIPSPQQRMTRNEHTIIHELVQKDLKSPGNDLTNTLFQSLIAGKEYGVKSVVQSLLSRRCGEVPVKMTENERQEQKKSSPVFEYNNVKYFKALSPSAASKSLKRQHESKKMHNLYTLKSIFEQHYGSTIDLASSVDSTDALLQLWLENHNQIYLKLNFQNNDDNDEAATATYYIKHEYNPLCLLKAARSYYNNQYHLVKRKYLADFMSLKFNNPSVSQENEVPDDVKRDELFHQNDDNVNVDVDSSWFSYFPSYFYSTTPTTTPPQSNQTSDKTTPSASQPSSTTTMSTSTQSNSLRYTNTTIPLQNTVAAIYAEQPQSYLNYILSFFYGDDSTSSIPTTTMVVTKQSTPAPFTSVVSTTNITHIKSKDPHFGHNYVNLHKNNILNTQYYKSLPAILPDKLDNNTKITNAPQNEQNDDDISFGSIDGIGSCFDDFSSSFYHANTSTLLNINNTKNIKNSPFLGRSITRYDQKTALELHSNQKKKVPIVALPATLKFINNKIPQNWKKGEKIKMLIKKNYIVEDTYYGLNNKY